MCLTILLGKLFEDDRLNTNLLKDGALGSISGVAHVLHLVSRNLIFKNIEASLQLLPLMFYIELFLARASSPYATCRSNVISSSDARNEIFCHHKLRAIWLSYSSGIIALLIYSRTLVSLIRHECGSIQALSFAMS